MSHQKVRNCLEFWCWQLAIHTSFFCSKTGQAQETRQWEVWAKEAILWYWLSDTFWRTWAVWHPQLSAYGKYYFRFQFSTQNRLNSFSLRKNTKNRHFLWFMGFLIYSSGNSKTLKYQKSLRVALRNQVFIIVSRSSKNSYEKNFQKFWSSLNPWEFLNRFHQVCPKNNAK